MTQLKHPLTQEGARAIFDYRDGVLYWKQRRVYERDALQRLWESRFPNRPAGTIVKHAGVSSYRHRIITLTLCGIKKLILASRLVWLWHNGEIPEGLEVDHKDRDPLNNLIDNLRLATHQQNSSNRGSAFKENQLPRGITKNRGTITAAVWYGTRRFSKGFAANEIAEASEWIRQKSLELNGEFSPFYDHSAIA